MCGENVIFKNVVLTATFAPGVISVPVHIALPFAPDLVKVTHLTYAHDDNDDQLSLYNLNLSMLQEPIAQLSTIQAFQNYSIELNNMFKVLSYYDGIYNLSLVNPFTGEGTDGDIKVAINLLFSKKVTM